MNYTKLYCEDLIQAQIGIPNLQNLQKYKILVTGAGGMIGSAVVDLLISINDMKNAKNTIYLGARNPGKIQKRFAKVLERKDVVFFPYDSMRLLQSGLSFDYIIHTASPANPGMYSTIPVETMVINFQGTYQLLQFACKTGCKRLLYVSSSEVYGNKMGDKPYTEKDYGFVDILNPRACYPNAKRATETLCVSFYKEYGVDSVIVRPGHIYGPTATGEDNRASSQFFRDVIEGKDIVMKSAGVQLRSYCYCVDCASAVLAVLINAEPVCAYNISNKESLLTVRQLADMIAKCAGKYVVFENPSDEEVKSYNLMNNSDLDASKLEQLGWKGIFDSYTGIRHTFEIMRDSYHQMER